MTVAKQGGDASPEQAATFLVSFLVDARGGAMNGSRCPGLRIVIPPNAATGPTRVTCRLMRQGRVSRPPQLNDGEGLACRIIEMGPTNAKFNSHVLLEIPHFASLRDREREIVVYKSDNGDTWKEHTIEVTEQAVLNAVGGFFSPLETNEELRKKRVVRILTDSFPQYFALVTRIRQESALIGPEGGVISSTIVSQVQAVFPEGALNKKIRVGIQAQPVGNEQVNKLLGSRVAVSPVVTIEPRRRKFHKPITLTIPLPRPATRGVTSPGESPTLRLLCSITGSTQPATWEDITGSTPLSYVKDCVSFTTTVSARFWLMDCPNTSESAEMAGRLYREAFVVPYMGRFAIFAKRHEPDEAKLRCFCITDDKIDKTLECNEGFERPAWSPEFEVLEGKQQWIEGVGNLQPMTKSGEQLYLPFKAFRENRLAFTVRVKDTSQPAVGKIAFLKDPRPTKPTDSPSLKPICTLEVALPDFVPGTDYKPPAQLPDQPELLNFANDSIARSELDLRDIADCLGADWPMLARELGVGQPEVVSVRASFRDERDRGYAMLCHWQRDAGETATGNELERCLRRIGREDVVKKCMRNVEYVVEEAEREQAKSLIDKEARDDQTADAGDEEKIVEKLDESREPPRKKSEAEMAEEKKAKTEAFLSLIDTMEELTPEPVVHRRESDAGDQEVPVQRPVEESAPPPAVEQQQQQQQDDEQSEDAQLKEQARQFVEDCLSDEPPATQPEAAAAAADPPAEQQQQQQQQPLVAGDANHDETERREAENRDEDEDEQQAEAENRAEDEDEQQQAEVGASGDATPESEQPPPEQQQQPGGNKRNRKRNQKKKR